MDNLSLFTLKLSFVKSYISYIHQISMLKNKIYNYFSSEILKSFIIILFAFTAIAWTVRAVNFVDLIVDDGHSLITYLLFCVLNITSIATKFIPLSFLIALIISIIKFQRQNEMIILWTSGVNKLKVVNLFILISMIITFLQLIFATYITPTTLFKSRDIIRSSAYSSLDNVIRSNNFNDTFKDLIIFFENRTEEDVLENIFIKDYKSYIGNLVGKKENSNNTTIIAKRGFVDKENNKKLVLFNGVIQSQDKSNNIETVNFKKTEIILDNLNNRAIIIPKIQETPTLDLVNCLNNNSIKKNFECPNNKDKRDVMEHISRRLGMPIYIPLIAVICSFLLLSHNVERKRKVSIYIYFSISFLILIFAEIFVRYAGFSKIHTLSYFLFPVLLMPIIYFTLFTKLKKEKFN